MKPTDGTATVYNVRDFAALGDGARDDTANIQAAIDAAQGDGGVVWFPGGTYRTTGTLIVRPGVSLAGPSSRSTTIAYTGSGIAVNASMAGEFTGDQSISGLAVTGTAAGTVGIRIGDTWGFGLRNISVREFTTGIGIQLYNDTNWTEGTFGTNIRVQDCAVGVSFTRSASSAYDSFGYTRLLGLAVNVPENGIGMYVGDNSELAATHYIYHSDLEANFWLDTGATAVAFSANTTGTGNRLQLTGENESGATGTRSFSAQAPSFFRATGAVSIAADTVSFPSDFNLFLMLGAFDSGPRIEFGSGNPEGDVTAPQGSLFIRSDGGATTTLYVKTSGTGNTGWTAK